MYRKYVKRLLDFLLSLFAIIILSPLMLIIALLVKFNLGSPIIFKQQRPGLEERIFNMYKFRSMTNAKDVKGNALPDKDRLTDFGKFLRSTSLDELPSLINIVKGDMSIVGPRPLLVQYLPYYYEEERLRHSVRPGLTGLAQINGRATASWEDRFAYDIQYVNQVSFINDIKIIIQTLLKVIKKADIGEPGKDTPGYLDENRAE